MSNRTNKWSAKTLSLLLLVVALTAAAGASVSAQPSADDRPFVLNVFAENERVTEWNRALDSSEEKLSAPGVSEETLEKIRKNVEDIRYRAFDAYTTALGQVKLVKEYLDALGPAPEKDESPEIVKQRKKLDKDLAFYEGHTKQADLIEKRTGKILAEFLVTRHQRLAERLLERGPTPFSPAVWAKAIPELVVVLFDLTGKPFEWVTADPINIRSFYTLLSLVVGLGLAVLIGWPVRRWLLQRFGWDSHLAEPSYARRLLAATVEGIARGLLPALAIIVVYLTFLGLNLLTSQTFHLAEALCLSLVFFIIVISLTRAALAFEAPQWSLVPLIPENARALGWGFSFLAAVFAVNIFLNLALVDISLSVELKTALGFIINNLIAFAILYLLRPRLWQSATPPPPEETAAAKTTPAQKEALKVHSLAWPSLRIVMGLVSLTVPLWSALGFYELASHLATNLVWTGVLVAALWLLHELTREILGLLLSAETEVSQAVIRTLGLGERGVHVLQFWLLFFFGLVLIFVGLVLVLPIWDVRWADFSRWVQASVFGFNLDKLALSLGDFALTASIFIAILITTRWFQRMLEERIFPQTQLDMGVRHSLRAAAGYAGLIVAVLTTVVVWGLDLSNLAIVVGALSVGIGFGLQNVVNNIVSGLILLAERPIQVGDWVVVGNQEGIVSHINVRATEILTFQKASVIVPNAEILSSVVVNWTHKTPRGRVEIPVGVAYGSDTSRVREILRECAEQHHDVQKVPTPQIVFKDFGESALCFELRFFVPDITKRLAIASDLRFAIDAAFREAGIEIPFLQTDIHLRDLDRIEKLFSSFRDTAGKDGQPGNS